MPQYGPAPVDGSKGDLVSSVPLCSQRVTAGPKIRTDRQFPFSSSGFPVPAVAMLLLGREREAGQQQYSSTTGWGHLPLTAPLSSMCLLAKPKDGCKGKVWGCLNALLGFPAKSLMINSGYKILLVQQLLCIPLTKAAAVLYPM